MKLEFYRCKKCGQIVKKLVDKGTPLSCCGEEMEKLIPNTTEAAVEKHIPVVSVKEGVATVCVGSVAHPMLDVHYIEFIILATNQGAYKMTLKPGDAPCAVFKLREGEKVEACYAYCNLHGLWYKEV